MGLVGTVSWVDLPAQQLITSDAAQLPVATTISTDPAAEDDFGRIEGKIKTNDQRAAAMVTVFIRETGKSYITSDNGSFTIGRLKPGKYTLEVSLIGYETLVESVTVEEGKTTTVQLQLEISNAQLEEIVVKSARNRFAPVASLHAAKMPLAVLENPQSISTVNKALMKEQMLVNVDDALKNTT